MTISAGKKIFENLKLENYRSDISLEFARYVYHLNTFHLLKTEGVNRRVADSTSKKSHQKMPGIYQNLDFNIT